MFKREETATDLGSSREIANIPPEEVPPKEYVKATTS